MKKSHLDKNNTIKNLIIFLIFFILVFTFFSFLFRGKIVDAYSGFYSKFFINKNEFNLLREENSNLKNELQSLKNLFLEKKIAELEISSGIIDNIKAKKISYSFLGKDIIYSEIILNKGYSQNINLGSKVYVAGFKPVGIINEVNKDTSKLKLYSYSNFENEFILNSNNLENSENKISSEVSVFLSENSSSSEDLENSASDLKIIKYKKPKDYIFKGEGDGAFGIKIRVPSDFPIEINSFAYTKEDLVNPVGEIVSVKEIISQKEKEVYVKTYYNPSIYTDFYINH